MKSPMVFVIILNWNGAKDTLQCVKSFFQLQYPKYKLIVVDNCSTDDSVMQIRENFPGVYIIETDRNLGYTGGNNIGIRYAMNKGAEYVLIINNDTELVNLNLLQKMIYEMERDLSVGIMGPKVLNPGGAIQDTMLSAPVFINCLKASLNLRLGTKAPKDYSIPQEVEAVSGVCWLIRRKVIKQIGLLDEDYFMYVEEQDYCYRAQKAGWKVMYFPIESVLHYKEIVDTNRERNFRQYLYVRRNLVLFLHKHFNYFQAVALTILFLISNLFKFLISKVTLRDEDFYKGSLLLSLFKELKLVLTHFKKHV